MPRLRGSSVVVLPGLVRAVTKRSTQPCQLLTSSSTYIHVRGYFSKTTDLFEYRRNRVYL